MPWSCQIIAISITCEYSSTYRGNPEHFSNHLTIIFLAVKNSALLIGNMKIFSVNFVLRNSFMYTKNNIVPKTAPSGTYTSSPTYCITNLLGSVYLLRKTSTLILYHTTIKLLYGITHIKGFCQMVGVPSPVYCKTTLILMKKKVFLYIYFRQRLENWLNQTVIMYFFSTTNRNFHTLISSYLWQTDDDLQRCSFRVSQNPVSFPHFCDGDWKRKSRILWRD